MMKIFRALNRPLPAWATILLFCAMASGALATVPLDRASLRVPSGGTITDTNASSGEIVSTAGGGQFQYGAPGSNLTLSGSTLSTVADPVFSTITANTLKAQPAPNVKAGVQLSASGDGVAYADLTSDRPNNFIAFEDDAPNIGSLINVGEIYAKAPNAHCGGVNVAHIDLITAGNRAHPGGAMTFHTSDDSGSCTDAENLVLPTDHHVYMPQDQWYHQWNTPSACAALVPCGTIVWNFTTAFHNTSGQLNVPHCPTGMVEDDNDTGTAWVLSVHKGGLSAGGVAYDYTPLTATHASTTLEAWAMCFSSSY